MSKLKALAFTLVLIVGTLLFAPHAEAATCVTPTTTVGTQMLGFSVNDGLVYPVYIAYGRMQVYGFFSNTPMGSIVIGWMDKSGLYGYRDLGGRTILLIVPQSGVSYAYYCTGV